jgi:hypothetical protein
MTKEQEDLIRKLRELAKCPVIIEVGTVKEVDEEELTCAVEPADGPEVFDVRLKAAIDGVTDGLVQIPTVGSTVLMALIGNDENTRVILAFSEVEKVVMFNGENDGLVKINDLVTKLNALENKVNDIVSKFNIHVHTGVTTGGGSSGTTPTTVSGTLTETQKSDLENTKVLH